MKYFNLLIIIVLSLFSQCSLAADHKIYPGSYCKAELGVNEAYLDRSGGRVKNTHTSLTFNVICPIINDSAKNKGITSSWVSIHTGIQTDKKCWVAAAKATGAPHKIQFNLSTSNGATRYSTNTDATVGATFSRYYLECELGPNSYILSYQANE